MATTGPPKPPFIKNLSLDATVFGNTVLDWLLALGTWVVSFVVILVVLRFIRARLRARAPKTPGKIDDLILDLVERSSGLTVAAVATYLASRTIVVPPLAYTIGRVAIIAVCAWQVARWLHALVVYSVERYLRQRALAKHDTDGSVQTTMVAVKLMSLLVVYSLVALVAVQNMGVNVTALVTGLGIGGIAVALAAQNILGDVFCAISITTDRPFVVGDFITVGELMGKVEHVGLKSTRLRSISGELLILRNTDLLASRIRNFQQMDERRAEFTVGVVYWTAADKLDLAASLIRKAIESQPDTRFDRCHFARFGASSLEFEAAYYVLSPEYSRYIAVQHAINIEIRRSFEKVGLDLAFAGRPVVLPSPPQQQTLAASGPESAVKS